MSTILKLPFFNDMHVHFREGTQMRSIGFHAPFCRYVLAMPNLSKPLTTGKMAVEYEIGLLDTLKKLRIENSRLQGILVALYLTAETTPQDIDDAVDCCLRVCKLYPSGVTTNSEAGVKDIRHMEEVFDAMERNDMILSIHGEMPGHTAFSAESYFFTVEAPWLVRRFPKLRIIFEHITTAEAVTFVKGARKNVAATITAHHLLITVDDVIGDKLRPRNFCKPIAKNNYDRKALFEAASNGDPRFFLGSDSAPHDQNFKLADACCAGVFTAPYLPGYLCKAFGDQHLLHRLPDFVAHNAARFYDLPMCDGTFELVKEPESVPGLINLSGTNLWYLPFMGDQPQPALQWQPKL